MAHTTIEGNLGKDPKLEYSQQGTPYVRFSVAWEHYIKDPSGQKKDNPPVWVYVTAFGNLAENIHRSLRKGDRVTVEGELGHDVWSSDHGQEQVFLMKARSVGVSLRYATTIITRNQSPQQPPAQQPNNGGFSSNWGDNTSAASDPWGSGQQQEAPF